MSSSDVVSVERVIAAPAAEIFALISDPSRHNVFDGSGSVQHVRGDVHGPVGLGDEFGMAMKIGLPYAMHNTIVEFEQDRLIAWKTVGPGPIGKFVGGRIWRYELEPADGGTLVRESWDISGESAFTKPGVRRMAKATRKNMEATLDRLAEHFAA